MPTNNFDQPIGEPVLDFVPGQLPDIEQLVGIYTIVEPLNVDRHFEDAYTFMVLTVPKNNGLICRLTVLKIKKILEITLKDG